MIPSLDFGGNGPALHFAHANSYPPECYRPLLAGLSARYHVFAMHQRPLWPDSRPAAINDWHPLTGDFFRFLDEQAPGPVIGVGHSLGGIVTLRAALRQPERFRALVLMDPVLFPPASIAIIRLARALGLVQRLHPLIPAAMTRRRVFASREELVRGYRRKPVFRYMSDASLAACAQGLTRPRPDGQLELAYSPEWEARIYVTGMWNDMDLWRGLPGLRVPLLVIRGSETDTFRSGTGRLVQRKQAQARVVSVDQSTHLVPLERPDEVSALIQSFLSEVLKIS
jgi:pimeloyl-ACP methyl ester carboxylesterase